MEFKPDFEDAFARTEAWWQGQVLDRALAWMAFPKPAAERVPVPAKHHASRRERWLDTQYAAERMYAQVANTVYHADHIPSVWPNLGPEVFAAFYGCELEFSDTTSWSIPILDDWSPASVAKLRLDTDGFYYRKILEMTDAYVERARGKFNVGYTDIHCGGDAIAAFRDPQQLCVDLIEHPEEVKALNERVTDDFLRVFDDYHARLTAAGMLSAGWMSIVGAGKVHIPSNDFSCMISDRMFEDIFLPGIARECAHMDRNIYHLDGPQALRFLDAILEVPNLHAIQWVPGAGRDCWRGWIEVYRRIQARGKGFVAYLDAADVEAFTSCLRPEGAWLCVGGVGDAGQADAVLRIIARWT